MKKQDYAFCKLFELGDLGNEFDFEQYELKNPVPHAENVSFTKTLNKFVVKNSSNIEKISGKKPLALLCIKNNVELLKFTYNKMKFYHTFDDLDLLVIDDRTADSSIQDFCQSEQVSYIRVENSLDEFNFSVLNNIGAYFAKKAGCDTIILWNSDLWPCDDESVANVLRKHKEEGCTISGTKLIYPKISYDGSTGDSQNVKTHFPTLAGKWRGTVQFGGSMTIIDPNIKKLVFLHEDRFKPAEYWRSNLDKPVTFITGAFKVIDLKWFFDNGGLNCSLASQLQDVELCFRAFTQDKIIMYFGKNSVLEHDESLTFFKEKSKFMPQNELDNLICSKITNLKTYFETIIVQK